eukprot:TRINITY_DN2390_c0_g2_i4.p1 TRINITY_DN2390_c0_g2~~TRINITY_DN2390_c0_g2_i4.p1  ORF type:complete len:300 (+),score=60.88 TRINITY_DN2390_c0_g2_i4:49-948(+)
MSVRRAASHAGSWYSGDKAELGREISSLLEKASVEDNGKVKAIISPHAGLSYSGLTASHGFKGLSGNMHGVNKVFVLGPSHRAYFPDVRLTSFRTWDGPISNVQVDTAVNEKLISDAAKMGLSIKYLNQETDVEEHSIELQMPFLSQLLKGTDATIVPMVVGMLDEEGAASYGRLLAPYFDDPGTRFVISSDFCHWGSRFRYTYHYEKSTYPLIGDAVIAMDHAGMELMEKQDRNGLAKYFEKTENTICGRSPITVLLNAMAASSKRYNLNFVHYSQSSKCESVHDSSVSYASALVTEA